MDSVRGEKLEVKMEQTYRRLAERLNALPNGFPPTKSGVELQLLEKLFTLEEATVAGVMGRKRETADDIAHRAGTDPRETAKILKGMVRKGLVRMKREERSLRFSLMPFIVGFYEEQLLRLDKDLAGLIELYMQEAGKDLFSQGPSFHRVIPMEKAISFELEVFPYERALKLLEGAKAWGVRDCICRVQQKLVGKGCDHTVENCLMFAPIEHVFDRSEITRAISKEEAIDLLIAAGEEGLIHSTANHEGPLYYICNCCTCCCGIMRGLTEFGAAAAVTRSDFIAEVTDGCVGCGDCVDRCSFGALSVVDEVCIVENSRCVGCGQCTAACPAEAILLKRREGSAPLPSTLDEWSKIRAAERNLPFED